MKKTNKRLIAFILISCLFLCIGYAEITNTELKIAGMLEASAQEGVFISNVETTDTLSKINAYVGTMLDTKTVLGTASSSEVSYNITLYNNSAKEHIFIGILTDEEDEYLYSNENIEYTLTGLKEYETIIQPNASLRFTITFKYKAGVAVANNVLESKLNFRFREKPEVALSNEGENYTLENIYPGYTSQEYKFTVTNENEASVPMTYSFETTISEPLKAEIYDGTTLVTGDTTLTNGEKEYTLKIVWQESANSTEYANKDYSLKVVLKAKPTNTDYAQYEINKEFNVQIKTAAFYFNAEPETTNITMENNEASLNLSINNYNSTSEYNSFDTNYEISLEDSSKFQISITDSNNGVISSGANTNNVTVKITPVEGATINKQEQINLIVKSSKPYVKEISKEVTIEYVIPIRIKDLPAGTYVNYVDNNGNKIPSIILYDTEYNTVNGTNYGVQAITAEPVKQVTLGGSTFEEARASYNSAIETLNNEAMTYLNTNYATDARCVGSLPSDKTFEGEEKDSSEYTNFNKTNYGSIKGKDENYIEDYTQMQKLGIIGKECVWFASRNCYKPGSSYTWRIRDNIDFESGGCILMIDDYHDPDEDCYTLGIQLYSGFRPVLKLKSNLQIGDGKGTAESPYDLVAGEKVPVETVTISGESTVAEGGTTQLTATVLPEYATYKTVVWSSSDTSIATVDENTGLVTGVTAGNVTISATVDGVAGTFEIEVIKIPVETVTISGNSSVAEGGIIQLTATVLPEDATDKTVVWSSSDTSIATIDVNTGLVTGVTAGGTVTISATADGVTGTYEVTVQEGEISITITSETGESTIEIGETLQLITTVSPQKTEYDGVCFISNADYIADVDENGLITAKAPGTTYIIAQLLIDGEVYVDTTFDITVEGEAIFERRRYRKFSLYDL